MTGSIRILVVEDQPLIAMDLEDLLTSRGYAVLGPKSTVAEALDCLGRETPDAALIDIDLRGERSYEVGAELRRRGVPFAFATGTVGCGDLPAEFAEIPVIRKPWCVDDLLDFVRTQTRQGR